VGGDRGGAGDGAALAIVRAVADANCGGSKGSGRRIRCRRGPLGQRGRRRPRRRGLLLSVRGGNEGGTSNGDGRKQLLRHKRHRQRDSAASEAKAAVGDGGYAGVGERRAVSGEAGGDGGRRRRERGHEWGRQAAGPAIGGRGWQRSAKAEVVDSEIEDGALVAVVVDNGGRQSGPRRERGRR